jgi:hypothetical protein
MMLPVAFTSKRSLRKIRRRAQDSFRIHLLTRDRVASRNTSTERDAKTKIANPKTISTIKALWCANIVETAIIGSAKAI